MAQCHTHKNKSLLLSHTQTEVKARPERVDVYILRSEAELLNRALLSAKPLSCFKSALQVMEKKPICFIEFENRQCGDCLKQALFLPMSQLVVLLCPHIACWFVNTMEESCGPCGFGSTFKEIFSAPTEKQNEFLHSEA